MFSLGFFQISWLLSIDDEVSPFLCIKQNLHDVNQQKTDGLEFSGGSHDSIGTVRLAPSQNVGRIFREARAARVIVFTTKKPIWSDLLGRKEWPEGIRYTYSKECFPKTTSKM